MFDCVTLACIFLALSTLVWMWCLLAVHYCFSCRVHRAPQQQLTGTHWTPFPCRGPCLLLLLGDASHALSPHGSLR